MIFKPQEEGSVLYKRLVLQKIREKQPVVAIPTMCLNKKVRLKGALLPIALCTEII